MPESIVQVTEGTGKKLHTWSRTVGANPVEDQAVFRAEYPYPSYVIVAGGVSTATLDSHLLSINAGASANVRIRRIEIVQAASATTATNASMALWRITSAASGGTAYTPRPYDTTDAASSFTARSLPTTKGTESVQLRQWRFTMSQTLATTSYQAANIYTWEELPGMKPIIIPAGTTNGVAIKLQQAVAGGTVEINVECVELTYS